MEDIRYQCLPAVYSTYIHYKSMTQTWGRNAARRKDTRWCQSCRRWCTCTGGSGSSGRLVKQEHKKYLHNVYLESAHYWRRRSCSCLRGRWAPCSRCKPQYQESTPRTGSGGCLQSGEHTTMSEMNESFFLTNPNPNIICISENLRIQIRILFEILKKIWIYSYL